MPPKKKGKKGKGGALIDGVDTSSMTREQLEAFAHRLKNEMEREREERNFFQLERDKLRTFWEITRNELESARAIIRNKDRQIEAAQEMAEIEIKHVNQQMKHLQYENQVNVGEIRGEAMAVLQLAQEEYLSQEQELLKDKIQYGRLLREKEETASLQIQQLKIEHAEKLSLEQQKFEQEIREMTKLHRDKLAIQQKDSDIKHRMEMFEVEERKNCQIKELINNHEIAFDKIKNYYSGMTQNNLNLISNLKEQIEELRKTSGKYERNAREVLSENKRLVEQLKGARERISELEKKLEHYDRDRKQLANTKTKLNVLQNDYNSLKWEVEAVRMHNETLQDDREKQQDKFEEAIMELQQKSSLKTLLLERKVNRLEVENEKHKSILDETLGPSGIDPQKVLTMFENLYQEKNTAIQDLRYENVRVIKAHNDLLAAYETKLAQFGIPKEELGFEPLRTASAVKLGAGPAGLVTKNR